MRDVSDLFRAHHRTLWGLCYRLTGCAADADDIVQETFARALKRPAAPGDPSWKPWLTRVATRLGIDVLRRRRRRGYVGSWLPSPIETADEPTPAESTDSPETQYARLESVSFAFLLALEALSPRQRAVLLLRDVFDYSARDVADVLEMSEANVRITHHRARRVLQAYDQSRCPPTAARQEQTMRVLAEFVRCLVQQDAAGVEAVLADGVRTVTDAGGEYTALATPLFGRARVATLHLRVAARRAPGARTELRLVNGMPAVVIQYATAQRRQAPRAVLRCELDGDGRIAQVHVVLASRKLSGIRFPSTSPTETQPHLV